MKLEKLGSVTSAPQISHISSHGFWLFVGGKEYFLDFDHFPWFRNATVAQISKLECQFGRIFTWPDLNVDLDLERIEQPDKFPLVDRINAEQGP
ncbi:MAG: DUF2442 domain-containing protein [Candidatus Methylacidiphilales bacterium]